MVDIFDTRFEGKELDLEDNRVEAGADINIMAKDPALKRVHIGVGWDLNAFESDTLDLDVSCILLDKDGQTTQDEDLVFYNNEQAYDGAVKHNGDSRTGAGDGDDESMTISLEGLPFEIVRVLFVVSIYQANYKEQNMSMVRNAYVRLVNADTTLELLRYELKDRLRDRTEQAMIVASLDRLGPKWHFKTLEEFVPDGLPGVAGARGIIVGQV